MNDQNEKNQSLEKLSKEEMERVHGGRLAVPVRLPQIPEPPDDWERSFGPIIEIPSTLPVGVDF